MQSYFPVRNIWGKIGTPSKIQQIKNYQYLYFHEYSRLDILRKTPPNESKRMNRNIKKSFRKYQQADKKIKEYEKFLKLFKTRSAGWYSGTTKSACWPVSFCWTLEIFELLLCELIWRTKSCGVSSWGTQGESLHEILTFSGYKEKKVAKKIKSRKLSFSNFVVGKGKRK